MASRLTAALSWLTIAFLPALAVGETVTYAYYEGHWSVMPDFDTLTPKTVGLATNFHLGVAEQSVDFAIHFTGFIDIPTSGDYTFYTLSDDGSMLYVGSALVVNNDGAHGPVEKGGSISLVQGLNPITVDFFQYAGGEMLQVSWAGPGITREGIPDSVLSPVPGSTESNPVVPPGQNPDGSWSFEAASGDGRWFDPPMTFGYRYTTDGNSEFVEVGVPLSVPDADGVYTVTFGSVSVNLAAGQRFSFPDPVSSFEITGIDPSVDGGDPLAFPTYLVFDQPVVNFDMAPLPIPTPSALVGLVGMGLMAALGCVWRRRKRAA